MDGGVGWVADAEQQHLPVQLDAPPPGCRCREGSRPGAAVMRAAWGQRRQRNAGCRCADARLPEGIGDHAHFFDAGGRLRIKGASSHDMLGITSACGAQGSLEGGDQSGRAALHRFDLREGAVDEQHAARLNTEGVELGDQLGLRNGLLWHEGIISQTPPESK